MHQEIAGAFGLDGCVAVITGAASGIGRETARVLTMAGARAVLADVDERGLASEASGFITGQVLRANGGSSM